MVVIRAHKTILTCPETGEDVVLQKDCLNPNDNGDPCPSFKHFGIQGNHIYVACKSVKLKHVHKSYALAVKKLRK